MQRPPQIKGTVQLSLLTFVLTGHGLVMQTPKKDILTVSNHVFRHTANMKAKTDVQQMDDPEAKTDVQKIDESEADLQTNPSVSHHTVNMEAKMGGLQRDKSEAKTDVQKVYESAADLQTNTLQVTLNLEDLHAFDEDGDGVLRKEELDEAMMAASFPESGMGAIPLEMLQPFYKARGSTVKLEDVRAFDKDEDGVLHLEELDAGMLALMPQNEMGAKEKNEFEITENVTEHVGFDALAERRGRKGKEKRRAHTNKKTSVVILSAKEGFPTKDAEDGDYTVENIIKYVIGQYNDFLYNRGMDRVKIRLLHYPDSLSATMGPPHVIVQFQMKCGDDMMPEYELAEKNGRCPQGMRYVTDFVECLMGKFSTLNGGPIETSHFQGYTCGKSPNACIISTEENNLIYQTNRSKCSDKNAGTYEYKRPICSESIHSCHGTDCDAIPKDFCKMFAHWLLYPYMFKPAFAGKIYGKEPWAGYDASKQFDIECSGIDFEAA